MDLRMGAIVGVGWRHLHEGDLLEYLLLTTLVAEALLAAAQGGAIFFFLKNSKNKRLGTAE